MSRTGDEDGFTLAEMLVVLAILSLVAGASGLALASGRTARELPRTVERLADDLRRTRIDAIRSGRMRSLAFDLPARLWRRETAEPVAIPPSVTLDLTTAREANEGAAAIAFLPNGRSTGGRVDLGNGIGRRSLVVDWLTGAVREVAP
ncbi:MULTISPECIES: GspH/FimT family pseudopilin [unclassified Aureimonas]|uniref:GspH/FimT family pseudopilin n=1 Tax=unclassified Aureimonas TaxID=2615206 RepID=UPI000701849F|nr:MULTISPECIES: GspH/FimT family pseudopilin [unclassified Aureimonas]KQT69878.1 hypothetical protein ASG62_01885 [Aureimonas sp. Leaf427]KQT75968.1 hypothetical protein ASG54_14335 [Aureimonas sp. Leaf460]